MFNPRDLMTDKYSLHSQQPVNYSDLSELLKDIDLDDCRIIRDNDYDFVLVGTLKGNNDFSLRFNIKELLRSLKNLEL